ncbi:MAG: hypoxanthine phosphoribosyltransferase [Acidobacteriota bacterium]
MDSSAIETRVQALGKQIADDYKGKNPHLVAVLKGASIFHADLVRAIPLELSYDFIAVSSYEDQTSSSGEVRILKDLDQSIEGKDVLLIEDIVDTGLTLHFLKKSLLARKPNSFKVVTLLNKPSQRRIDVRLDYIGFDIPDQFLVGYGLDYAQRFRNLSGIHRLDL